MNPKEIQILKKMVYDTIVANFQLGVGAEDPFAIITGLSELSEIYYKLSALSKHGKDQAE